MSSLGVEGAATRKYFDSDINNLKISEFVGTCFFIIFFTVLTLLLVSFFFSQYTSIFIGLDSPVVKSHGGTDFIGFSNSLNVCHRIVKGNLIKKIKQNI